MVISYAHFHYFKIKKVGQKEKINHVSVKHVVLLSVEQILSWRSAHLFLPSDTLMVDILVTMQRCTECRRASCFNFTWLAGPYTKDADLLAPFAQLSLFMAALDVLPDEVEKSGSSEDADWSLPSTPVPLCKTGLEVSPCESNMSIYSRE
jgi:hypothetical protein